EGGLRADARSRALPVERTRAAHSLPAAGANSNFFVAGRSGANLSRRRDRRCSYYFQKVMRVRVCVARAQRLRYMKQVLEISRRTWLDAVAARTAARRRG